MNKLDKIKEVQKFIESNKDKDLTWYADNNGIVSRRTFFNWKKDGLLSASESASASESESASASASESATPTSEIIQNLFEEHEKNETRKLKNRQYNYNTKIKKTLEELQKENEELKSKFDELQSKYEQLQTDLIFERQLKEKYENQIHDLPYKQSEFNELKNKYEKLQLDYFALKNGKESKDESNEKPKEQKSHNWWDEI